MAEATGTCCFPLCSALLRILKVDEAQRIHRPRKKLRETLDDFAEDAGSNRQASMQEESSRVAIVFGASRGIGRQIAISLAQDGYTVVLSSKSTGALQQSTPRDPNSQSSTIDTVLAEIRELGGSGLALPCDVRDDSSIQAVIDTTLSTYGKCDAMVYNPGAIWWSSIERTPTKRYDLMHQINSRGLYVAIQYLLPLFRRQGRGRIVSVSPPIYSRFVKGKTSYAMTKIAASVMTIGLAVDFEREFEGMDVGITSVWPAAAIQSAATRHADLRDLRKPTIFGDAVVEVLRAPVKKVSGRLLLDEDFLRESRGLNDEQVAEYAVIQGSNPRRIMPIQLPDLRVAEEDDEGQRIDSTTLNKPKL